MSIEIRSRIATLALGHTADQIMTKGFNYVLYPAVMFWFGVRWGTIMMIFLSFLLCLMTMKFYDWCKVDWLGIEILKQFRDDEKSKSRFSHLLSWAMRKGDWAVMLILSIYKDSFVTTVYMRHGSNKYNGMSRRDWKVFITSLIISCLWWSIVINVGISGIKTILHLLIKN